MWHKMIIGFFLSLCLKLGITGFYLDLYSIFAVETIGSMGGEGRSGEGKGGAGRGVVCDFRLARQSMKIKRDSQRASAGS